MSLLSDLYGREFDSIKNSHPNLQSVFKDNFWHLVGSVDIIDEFGVNWDNYQIKILFPHDFPNAVPIMYETGGRIEQNDDNHINPGGSCCLSVPALEMIILKKGITISRFLEELAIPFLANQTYKEKTGDYANGEFGHGVSGLYQFYTQAFDNDNPLVIFKGFEAIILNKIPGRNDPCFCGAEEKFKNCHLKSIEYLSPVSRKILTKDFQVIKNAVEQIIKDDNNKN